VTPSAAEQIPPPLPAPVSEDPDAALAEMLDSLSAADNYLDLIDELTRPQRGVGSTLLVNVLEHLPNDVDSLSHLGPLVGPGGTIVTFVPAFDLLYSHFDRTVGHYRRYRKASLTETFTAAGLEPRLVRYVNLPGWFSWLLVVRVARLNPSRCCLVKAHDRLVLPMVRVVESLLAPPFGQSLLGVAEVPTA